MPGIPPTVAQETPLQTWVNGWLAYLSENLPVAFLVVAVLVGILLLIRGGVKQTVMFAIGAALAFLVLTNLESFAAFFGEELPLPDSPAAVVPQPTPGGGD